MGHGHSHDHGSHGHSHGDHGHAHDADGACGGNGGGPASASLPGGAGAALLAARGLGSAEGATLVIRLVAADGSPLLVRTPRLEVDVKDWSGARVLPFEAAPAEGGASSSVFIAKANRMSPEAGPLTLTAQLPLADGSTATVVWADFFPRKHTA